MQPVLDLGGIFFTTFLAALFTPLFWVVLFLVFMQYRRQALAEQKLFGRLINRPGRQMLLSVSLGALGGLLASVLLIASGLSLEQIGLYFIWPVALLLLLINPRYLCFSYAGGLVAVALLIVRYLLLPVLPGLAGSPLIEALLRIHIPALLVLIGLLHLVEALLIYLGGHWGSSPVYLKQADGKVVGAFVLQRFWPLPLVALLVAVVAQGEIAGVSMPEWWPILKSPLQLETGQALQYMIIPVAAGLGYADLAFSSTPRERSAFAAKWLAVYSLILLAAAIASEYRPELILPAVLFAPLGHEMLIHYSNKKEAAAIQIYRQTPGGVRLMLVLPATAAAEAGLASGDLICRVNGAEVHSDRELLEAIDRSYFLILLEGLRGEEKISLVLKKNYLPKNEEQLAAAWRSDIPEAWQLLRKSAALGLIAVPSADSPVYLEVKKPDPLRLIKHFMKQIRPARPGGK